ncbi:hypothetical protein chiPu_0012614 [Chiloscyllium punctatum]|uniref:Uncharacterized protein n=1 Tax=Chiloscyllium punctatum TaxID=137246 RepID=A0A401SUS0_CHIPU|nr:hypothetical protein [Chiloscyllium punctatum]
METLLNSWHVFFSNLLVNETDEHLSETRLMTSWEVGFFFAEFIRPKFFHGKQTGCMTNPSSGHDGPCCSYVYTLLVTLNIWHLTSSPLIAGSVSSHHTILAAATAD